MSRAAHDEAPGCAAQALDSQRGRLGMMIKADSPNKRVYLMRLQFAHTGHGRRTGYAHDVSYEDVAKRMSEATGLTHEEVDDIIDYLGSVARLQEIHFLWRPILRDAHDDHVLELAVEASCEVIVSHNVRDFAGSERFGVEAVSPREFLRKIGGLS